MTGNQISNASLDFVTTLAQAAARLRAKMGDRNASSQENYPPPKVVTEALLHAEKAAKQQHQRYPVDSLLGYWRLCFTTSGKVHLRQSIVSGKRGFYVPQISPAQISFTTPASTTDSSPDDVEIGNQVQLGPLLFRLTGQTRYLDQKNLLAFDFTHMQLSLFGKTLYQGTFPWRKTQAQDFHNQPLSKLPFFTFFLITEDFIAARGRGGGLALWVKEFH